MVQGQGCGKAHFQLILMMNILVIVKHGYSLNIGTHRNITAEGSEAVCSEPDVYHSYSRDKDDGFDRDDDNGDDVVG